MRIRPFCVFAILSWGFTWGAGHAAAQGFPAYAPNGYPPPGYGMPYGPPPGYGMPYGPPPGYLAPPPGMPMQGMPMQGMPMQGMPMQGMPMPGIPMQGSPVQGTPVTPAFPGFAPYAGSQATPVTPGPSTPVVSTPVPALPTGSATAGDGAKGPAGSIPAAPSVVTEKGEKIAAPVAQPTPLAVPPPTGAPVASEPMISFINGMPPGYLQPYAGPDDDHGGPVPHPQSCDHAWFGLSYLMGFIKPGALPIPLVTTGSPADPRPGALGQPGTSVLFGDRLDFSMQSGFRMNFGTFLDNSGTWSVEGDLMYFIPVGIHFQDASNGAGFPIITRPFYDVSGVLGVPPGPGEHAYVIAAPATTATPAVGGTAINANSDLYGFEVNGRYHWRLGPQWGADALAGFRYLHLDESLLIQDNITLTTAIPAFPAFGGIPGTPGSILNDFDNFATRNNFYGAQLGGRITWQEDWLFASAYSKLALGATTQQVLINGRTTLTTAGTVSTAQGGVLALPSNIGNYRRTMFGVVPEEGVIIGINITRNLQLYGGYSFLLMNTVVRPGGQVDQHVNATQIPGAALAPAGPAAPLFHFNGELFWMNQLNIGLNWHF